MVTLTNTHRVPLIVISAMFPALGTLMVFLRFWARRFILNAEGYDDYLMYAAWIASIGFTTASTVGVKNGVGLFELQVDKTSIIKAVRATFFLEIFYYSSIYLIKMSILMFYTRMALRGKTWTCNLILMGLVTAQFISTIVVVFLQCRPISHYWVAEPGGSCISVQKFFYSANIFTIVTDIAIIILPIPTLMRVSRPLPTRLALIAVFLIGVFSTIASGVRIYTIKLYTVSTDPVYDAAPIFFWSIIEINVGIICASGPSLQQLFQRLKAILGSRKLSNASSDFRHVKGDMKHRGDVESHATMQKERSLTLIPRTEELVWTTCEASFTKIEEGEWISPRKLGHKKLASDRILVSTEMSQSVDR